jgi:hypothetical protein
MPWVGFERTIQPFQWPKAVHALDLVATVIGVSVSCLVLILKVLLKSRRLQWAGHEADKKERRILRENSCKTEGGQGRKLSDGSYERTTLDLHCISATLNELRRRASASVRVFLFTLSLVYYHTSDLLFSYRTSEAWHSCGHRISKSGVVDGLALDPFQWQALILAALKLWVLLPNI